MTPQEAAAVEPIDWQAVPVLAGLSAAEWQPLAEAVVLARYRAGATILAEGTQSQNLWVVLEGTCTVSRQGPPGGPGVILAELGPNSQFGEMSFFQPVPHSASVRAQTAVTLLKIPRADFDRLLNHGCCGAYKVAVNLVASLAERLRRMDEWVTELVTAHPTDQPAPVRADEWATFRTQIMQQVSL